MVFKGGIRENRLYIVIAIFTILVIIFAIIFGTSQFIKAYIRDEILGDFWSEDINERAESSQLFGIEKWISFTYRNDNESYPAYVTVTSIKMFFMLSENDLIDKTIDTLNMASDQGIEIDENSKVTDRRVTRDGNHKTTYFIFDGNDTSKEPFEKIRIIGECWNCEKSGTSVICIGIAQISDNTSNNSEIDITYWAEIIKDKIGTFGPEEYKGNDGLIFNVICH